MTTLELLPVPAGPAVRSVLPALQRMLDGDGPALLPVPAGDERETLRLTDALSPGDPVADGVGLVVATSGTTGIPKGALLSAQALRASGDATHARLGGTGSWLLALPAHHIAGMQVLLRSLLSGTEPVVVDVSAGFDPAGLPAAVDAMAGPRRYSSMVPTQLIKALDHPDATAALARLDAILLGGAATPVPVLERARAAGITVVRTYGMSETCGGCVYDGVPLDGVHVRVDGESRVWLGGATLASGYRNLPDHPAFAEPGWFRTDDAGTLDDGVLRILGRLDEAISTGGLTVVPQVVEAVLVEHPAVREVAVVGLPDPRLGQRVAAVVVPTPGTTPTLAELRDHVEATLDPTAAPRELQVVDTLPLRGPGKVDRRALVSRFS
ncbi:o-succinylbenzoate--CoA ligase [Rhodococcus rhodochrous]|uniref:o-succinylbenzoate--CoA ligase n=2 Tax=Rhodococcus rhodochrous TaxID=1829 RepID=UPI001E37E418|nr:o-succinylbenzoate--CoA ligase [Rhodococcus rhodochrous]MCD2097229.1 o-succinylbenzoate--CoA ligase [Rhodococcus rhodochrous]MCD2120339.1 o-succinylbenzoate--CoA ligase [Rhodococcus rhodochrous]MCQ4133189.1 o-succinylbenzoate--CoA ligase [Rhodococcus rhodochrous]MDJ0017204.1 o-succinylbenzoate--CoA ligase [Rhodococcus rhodochrous]